MTGKNDAVNESLSALMDAEHSELDLRRVLKAAESDNSVLDTWANYHKQKQLSNKELDLVCNDGFLAGIRDAIEYDEKPEQVDSHHGAWRQFASKGAVAACFTFAFLIGASQLNFNGEPAQSEGLASVDSSDTSAVVPSGFELPPLTARTVSSVPASGSDFLLSQARSSASVNTNEFVLSPEMQEQLHRMIMRHAEQTSANGALSVLPFSRVNTLDAVDER